MAFCHQTPQIISYLLVRRPGVIRVNCHASRVGANPQAFPSHTMAYQHSNSYASSYKYSYFDREGFSGMPPAEARAPIFQGVHDA